MNESQQNKILPYAEGGADEQSEDFGDEKADATAKPGMGGMKRSTTIKMSDNEEVRQELIVNSKPNALTSFFYRRPCISMWTPYIIMFLMSVIISSTDYFEMSLEDDSWLVNDDEKVINRDMVKLAKYELNRKAAGIDDKKDQLEANQVRFENTFMDMLMIIYEDKSDRATGLVDHATIRKMIVMENEIVSWNKKSSDEFRNKKFNGNTEVSWAKMCYAGLDAEVDHRTGEPKCLEDIAYISIATLFRDNFKMCFTNPLCGPALHPDGQEGLDRMLAGTKANEDEMFLQFFDTYIPESQILQLLQWNMSQKAWSSYVNLFDKNVHKKIKDLMFDVNKVKCLIQDSEIAGDTSSDSDDAKKLRVATQKVAAYKALSKSDVYKINKDFFQIDYINPATGEWIPGYTPCFTTEERTPKVTHVMSMLQYGTPMVPPSKNKVDKDMSRTDEERTFPDDVDMVTAFTRDVKKMIEDKYPEDQVKFKVYMDGPALQMDRFMDVFASDSGLVLFSILFVWGFITQHTQSCMLSSLGMGVILLSFTTTAFFVACIFQVWYFGFLQIMIIFIVLGIAADDIFVFYDAFQQSAEMDRKVMDTMEKRLAYSFRRAAKAMAVTSSTTCVAFMANAITPITQIQTFGIFAGVIVPINYIIIIFVFPPACVWYEEKILAKVVDENGNVVKDAFGREQYKCPNCICWAKCCAKCKQDEYGPDGKKLAKLSAAERFFDEKIDMIVGHKIIKMVIIGVSVIWYGISIYFMTQIKDLTKQEDMVDEDHEVMETFTVRKKNMVDDDGGSGLSSAVEFLWGANGLDKENVPAWNVTYKGNVTFDASFADNFHHPVSQTYMRDTCHKVKQLSFVNRRVDRDKRDITVRCWTDMFINEYLAVGLLTSATVAGLVPDPTPQMQGDAALVQEWLDEVLGGDTPVFVDGPPSDPDDPSSPPSVTALEFAQAALLNDPGLLAAKVNKPETGYTGVARSAEWHFPIADQDEFWDHIVRFIQADNIKEKNGGKGVLESFLGIDYQTLDINPAYTLPKTKLAYTLGADNGPCTIRTPTNDDDGVPIIEATTLAKKTKKLADCQQYCDFQEGCQAFEFEEYAVGESEDDAAEATRKRCTMYIGTAAYVASETGSTPAASGSVQATGVEGQKVCHIKEFQNLADEKYRQFRYPSDVGAGYKKPKVKYVKMETEISVGPYDPTAVKTEKYDGLEALCATTNANAPTGLNNLKQGSEAWAFMPTEAKLKESAVQGISLALGFSFIIVLISTRNVINSFIAIWAVSMVIFSIMGWYYIRDWPMGTTESIAVVVLIGFSVDYIIHFSAEYMHSKEDTRELKMRQSLRQMGVSIFGGFITTLGSGFFLVLCEISFFWKFGETICMAVIFAFLIAVFTYSALMKTIGPVGTQGDLNVCMMAMRNKVQGNNLPKQEVPEDKPANDMN